MVWSTLQKRFESKYVPEPNTGCWLWTGAADNGYGRFGDWHDGRTHNHWAHRLSYQLYVGEIPDGTVIDHLCRNRMCVNPEHLDPVLHLINVQRGDIGKKPERTHCARGHEFTEDTTAWVKTRKNGRLARRCRRCHAANSTKSYRKVGRETRMTRNDKAA